MQNSIIFYSRFYSLLINDNSCNHSPDPGGSPCQYDEGSPLVQDFVDPDTLQVIPTAVGIFSKTNICGYGISEAAGIYTPLSEFSSWFLDTAGEQPVHPQGFR